MRKFSLADEREGYQEPGQGKSKQIPNSLIYIFTDRQAPIYNFGHYILKYSRV